MRDGDTLRIFGSSKSAGKSPLPFFPQSEWEKLAA
jgi:hypothetical protein